MGNRWILLVVGALALVAGCGSAPPVKEVRVVEKLVPQRCIDPTEVPPAPVYKTGVGPYVPVESPKILAADFEAAKNYIGELEALLPPCLRLPAPNPTRDSTTAGVLRGTVAN